MTELGELGLSSYEEQVYRTLLVTGATTAGALSDASDVPRGRIYDALNGLEARGLVRSKSTEPARYLPVEPETAIETLLAERTAELRAEWERYCAVASDLRSTLLPSTPADANLWLGGLGSESMRTAMRRHIHTATTSVYATIGPPYEAADWERLRTEFDAFFDGAAADLDVKFLLSDDLLDVLPEEFPTLVGEQNADVRARVRPRIPVSFDVIDRATATIDVPHPCASGDRLGVVGVTDATVVGELLEQFETLWADADPLLE